MRTFSAFYLFLVNALLASAIISYQDPRCEQQKSLLPNPAIPCCGRPNDVEGTYRHLHLVISASMVSWWACSTADEIGERSWVWSLCRVFRVVRYFLKEEPKGRYWIFLNSLTRRWHWRCCTSIPRRALYAVPDLLTVAVVMRARDAWFSCVLF